MSDYGGDEPDTFDGRLAGITQLIDTLVDEVDAARRRHRRAVIVRLLDQLREMVFDRIDEQRRRV